MFNEDSSVKIPALLHLMRLCYKYTSFNQQIRIEENNIFPSIFIAKISTIYNISEQDVQRLLDEINLEVLR
jgi:type I restriction enzyme R subunit